MGEDGSAVVRIVWGAATAPTAVASYDAALGAAGVGDYNLVRVSSILPADADLEIVGVAPDLGTAGGRLWVVEARATVDGPGHAVAGLAWAHGPGPGLFYEVGRTAAGHGTASRDAVAEELERGLAACKAGREWRFEEDDRRIVAAAAGADEASTAVVLGVFGTSEPMW